MVVSKITIPIKVIMDEFYRAFVIVKVGIKSVKGLSINVKLDFLFCTNKCAAI